MHDIEDLVAEGRRRKACPYFASTHLAEDAELVFCPYKSAPRLSPWQNLLHKCQLSSFQRKLFLAARANCFAETIVTHKS